MLINYLNLRTTIIIFLSVILNSCKDEDVEYPTPIIGQLGSESGYYDTCNNYKGDGYTHYLFVSNYNDVNELQINKILIEYLDTVRRSLPTSSIYFVDSKIDFKEYNIKYSYSSHWDPADINNHRYFYVGFITDSLRKINNKHTIYDISTSSKDKRNVYFDFSDFHIHYNELFRQKESNK